MNKILLSLLTSLALLAAPAVCFATHAWTSVCSAGTIDEASLGSYAVGNANLQHRSGSTTQVVARYNVTNTSVPSDQTPGWSVFQLAYFDNSSSGSVLAQLFEVTPCTGSIRLIAQISSSDASAATCKTASFDAAEFNFGTHLYYVFVSVTRSSTSVAPRAISLRIF